MSDTPTSGAAIRALGRGTRSRWAALGAAVAVSFGAGGLFQADAASNTSAPAVFIAVTPCRLLDTRAAPFTIGNRSAPVGPDTEYTASVAGTNGNCTLPPDASTLVMNVTVSNMTAPSYLTVYNADAGRPHTSSLNWIAGTSDVANAVTSNVSAAGEITFYNWRGDTDVVVDVVGYYTHAPLDDFYTKRQVDALIAANPAGVGPAGPQGQPGVAGAPGTPGTAGAPGVNGDSVLASLSCSTDQVIRYDGSGWACSNDMDTLASLHCVANQSPGFNGTAWVCRSAPIVSTLSRPTFTSPCCSLNQLFPAHSPNISSSRCDDFNCTINLIDVLDHTACTVAFSGNSQVGGIVVQIYTDRIDLNYIDTADRSQPLFITITCVT